MAPDRTLHVVTFDTELGWMALVGSGSTVGQLVFGHTSKTAAIAALRADLRAQATPGDWWPALVERLREFAEGIAVDFRDVEVDLEHLTPFQRRVMKHCRAIAYGDTKSYGALAKASGADRAARAVGSTMAANRVPLIIPCHRVINANGSIGHYSSVDGPRTKARLLAMEGRATGRRQSGPQSKPAKTKRSPRKRSRVVA